MLFSKASIFVLVLSLFVMSYLAYDWSRGTDGIKKFGWDTRVTCAGGDAYQNSLNPYYVKNLIGTDLSYTYQPALLFPISKICKADYEWHYYRDICILAALCALILALSFFDTMNLVNFASAFVLVAGSFGGLAWALRTGNIIAFEGLFVSIFLLCVASEKLISWPQWLKDIVGCVALGFALSIKLILIPVAVAVFLLGTSLMRRIRMFLLILFSYGVVFGISVMAYPDYTRTFLDALAGRIPGQHSPSTEPRNPSLYFLLDGSLHDLHLHKLPGYEIIHILIYGLIAVSIVALSFFKIKKASGRVNTRSVLDFLFDSDSKNAAFSRYAMVFLIFSMMLVVPRLKEYAFLTLALLSIPLVAPLQMRWRLLCLLFAVIPLIGNQPRAEFHAFPSGFIQFWSAFGIWAVALYHLPDIYRRLSA